MKLNNLAELQVLLDHRDVNIFSDNDDIVLDIDQDVYIIVFPDGISHSTFIKVDNKNIYLELNDIYILKDEDHCFLMVEYYQNNEAFYVQSVELYERGQNPIKDSSVELSDLKLKLLENRGNQYVKTT